MEHSKKEYWFVRKTYGYGWTPSNWKGWLAVGIFIFLFVLNNYFLFNLFESETILPHRITIQIGVNIFLIILLIFISYKKGEKPRWSWGER